jgi:hypothetical protein
MSILLKGIGGYFQCADPCRPQPKIDKFPIFTGDKRETRFDETSPADKLEHSAKQHQGRKVEIQKAVSVTIRAEVTDAL